VTRFQELSQEKTHVKVFLGGKSRTVTFVICDIMSHNVMKTEACCYLNLFSEQLFVLTLFIYTYLLFSLLYFASSFDMKCDFYQCFTVAFSGEK